MEKATLLPLATLAVLSNLDELLDSENYQRRGTMRNIREGSDVFGNLITQKRGLLALPILVLRAQEHRTITFKELGNAIGFSNYRRMGGILGRINTTHYNLERRADWEYGRYRVLQQSSSQKMVSRVDGYASNSQVTQIHRSHGKITRETISTPVFEYPHWGRVIEYVLDKL